MSLTDGKDVFCFCLIGIIAEWERLLQEKQAERDTEARFNQARLCIAWEKRVNFAITSLSDIKIYHENRDPPRFETAKKKQSRKLLFFTMWGSDWLGPFVLKGERKADLSVIPMES